MPSGNAVKSAAAYPISTDGPQHDGTAAARRDDAISP